MSERPSHRLVAPVAVAAVVGAALLVGVRPTPQAGPVDDVPSAARLVTAEEFCAGFGVLADAQEAHLGAASRETTGELKDAARAIGDLAPGTAMPARAQAGVAYVVTAFLSLTDDATAQDVVESDDAATLRDSANADALAAWIADGCGDVGLSQAK